MDDRIVYLSYPDIKRRVSPRVSGLHVALGLNGQRGCETQEAVCPIAMTCPGNRRHADRLREPWGRASSRIVSASSVRVMISAPACCRAPDGAGDLPAEARHHFGRRVPAFPTRETRSRAHCYGTAPAWHLMSAFISKGAHEIPQANARLDASDSDFRILTHWNRDRSAKVNSVISSVSYPNDV